ncbi:TerD family protein [Streptomyces sp. NPDC005963]|uniref:TerD family protein n=1 Tax=Streptomyces sp. NPDC005963 TaxID=3156721 RepID=UPI0033EBC7AC
MTQIIKGANVPVPTSRLRVAVGRNAAPGVPSVDASALLLDATGRVRGDADLVFYNQPQHPSGSVRHVGSAEGAGQRAEWLELDLPSVEPAIQRVVISASCDGAAFGSVPGLFIQAVGPDGAVVMHYPVTDATTETAFVLGEFYRRDGMWKFRAVGQGYASGLAGLATDFGIVVAQPPTAPQAPAAQPPIAPVPQAPQAPAPFHAPAVPAPAFLAPATVPRAFHPPAGPGAPGTYPPQPGVPGVPGVPGQHPAPPAAYQPTSAPLPYPYPYPQPPSHPQPAHQRPVPPAAPVPDPFSALPGFQPYTQRGHGTLTFAVDAPLPPGPALIEARSEGDGYFSVHSLTSRHEPDDMYFNTSLTDFRGRAIARIPTEGRLLLLVDGSENWTVVIHPLSAIRRLDGLAVEGRGNEVFAYLGPSANLDVRFWGSESRHDDITVKTRPLFPTEDGYDDYPEPLLSRAVGPFQQTVPVPAGPLFLTVEGEGYWSLHVHPAAGAAAR